MSKLIVGVAGGIAAYKAVELVRALQTAGLDPHVVLTAAAERFVTPLTFAAISGHTVHTSLWTGPEVPEPPATSSIEHIELAQTTRALVIAPATANTLAKLAHGLADDLLSTLYLALPAATPVILAPAMNVEMWRHPATQANLQTLQSRGVHIVEPTEGYLACGMEGGGRLADIPAIVQAVQSALTPTRQDLTNETILITAGGTREPIDAVRFLGNHSSGRMGYALAEAAAHRNARVILITAARDLPIPPLVAEVHHVNTAAEMHAATLAALPQATIVLKAAAVADYRPIHAAEGKLARDGSRTLELEPTEDIVAALVQHKRPNTLVIAFSAEIGLNLDRARAKMHRKAVDAIILNDIVTPGLGFDSTRNAGTMLFPDREVTLPESTKLTMAHRILDETVALRLRHTTPKA